MSLVVPYAAYLAGERAKASGVLAVVACGIYMSRKSTQFFSPAVRLQVNGAWEALMFMLNGLVFVLIGLQLPYVLAGIHGQVWDRDADFLWRGVQRGVDCAADGVGVSGGEDCVVCGAAVVGA